MYFEELISILQVVFIYVLQTRIDTESFLNLLSFSVKTYLYLSSVVNDMLYRMFIYESFPAEGSALVQITEL